MTVRTRHDPVFHDVRGHRALPSAVVLRLPLFAWLLPPSLGASSYSPSRKRVGEFSPFAVLRSGLELLLRPLACSAVRSWSSATPLVWHAVLPWSHATPLAPGSILPPLDSVVPSAMLFACLLSSLSVYQRGQV